MRHKLGRLIPGRENAPLRGPKPPATGKRRSATADRRTLAGPRAGGFTLLEVMLAVAIIAVITLGLYRFVAGSIGAAKAADSFAAREAELAGFDRFVQSQFIRLPSRLPPGAVLLEGKPARGGAARDTVTFLAQPGNGLLARRADGIFVATLEVVQPKGVKRPTLVLSRQRVDQQVLGRPSAPIMVELLPGVSALEIAYYDARINSWVESWADAAALPDLVRLRLSFDDGNDQFETVARLPPRRVTPPTLGTALPGAPGLPGATPAPSTITR